MDERVFERYPWIEPRSWQLAMLRERPHDWIGIWEALAYARDEEVMEAFQLCSRLEGIIPALESTHALVHGMKRAKEIRADEILVINLSGRGDKDVQQVQQILGKPPK